MKSVRLTALAGALLFAAPASAGTVALNMNAAVVKPGRPAEAVAMDASRKPAEVLSFLGLRSGMAAADIMTGSGYWAEIMANAVGAKGHVTAFEPRQFYTTPDEQKTWSAMLARRPDIRFVRYPFETSASAPRSFDFAMISLNYHDLYWESAKYKIPRGDPTVFLGTLYAAMKPGGVVGLIDHVGPPGDTRAIVNKLHRIDLETVKADFRARGFVLEAESPPLANPTDDHSKLVFDPSFQGKADRFVYRFRKPR